MKTVLASVGLTGNPLDRELAQMKGFGNPGLGVAFDATEPHQRAERFRSEPAPGRLAGVAREQRLDLRLDMRLSST